MDEANKGALDGADAWKEVSRLVHAAEDGAKFWLPESLVWSLQRWAADALGVDDAEVSSSRRTEKNKVPKPGQNGARLVGLHWQSTRFGESSDSEDGDRLSVQLVVGRAHGKCSDKEAEAWLDRHEREKTPNGFVRVPQRGEPKVDPGTDRIGPLTVEIFVGWPLPAQADRSVPSRFVDAMVAMADCFPGTSVLRANGNWCKENVSILLIGRQAFELPYPEADTAAFEAALRTALNRSKELLVQVTSDRDTSDRLLRAAQDARKSEESPHSERTMSEGDTAADESAPPAGSEAPFHTILRKLDEGGLYFPGETVANVLLAMQVKRFVILTGISGTGKTRIAQAIAGHFPLTDAASDDRPSNVEIVPVRPDWTDNRGLLGFYNPLTKQYVTTPFLRLMLAAADEVVRAVEEDRAPHPFFVLLDEMNLARVEHYFSDLLSAMESIADMTDGNGGMLHLHDDENLERGESEGSEAVVPRRLKIPSNLFILGTVNVDESTYMFSPKVLDRAFTVEFNAVDLIGFGKPNDSADVVGGELSTRPARRGDRLDLVRWDGRLAPPGSPGREDWQWLLDHGNGSLGTQLLKLHALLRKENRHFGYRVAVEVARFVRLAVEQVLDDTSVEDAARAALDLAILQKVLVKLAGTKVEIESLLDALLWFTLAGHRDCDARGDLTDWRIDADPGEVVASVAAPKERPLAKSGEQGSPGDSSEEVSHAVSDEDVGSVVALHPPLEGVPKGAESASIPVPKLPTFPRSAAKLRRMQLRLQQRGFTSWIE